MSEWRKFFLVSLPLAILAIGVLTEGAAHLLSGVTMHRHNVDDLAASVTQDSHPYRIVLLGDSVTHNVAHKFRIGDVDEVADMTTHALAGLPSSLFLLKRYLESGHHPQHVVIAASRGVFIEPLNPAMFKYYVDTTFTLPYEREFLEKWYPSYVDHRWRPAALSMTTKLGEPLFSLLRRPGNEIWRGPEVPPPDPELESFSPQMLAYDYTNANRRIAQSADVRPEIRAILDEFCALSHQYGFALHIVWAPLEPGLLRQWKATGKLTSLDEQLAQIFQADQTTVSIYDSNAAHEYKYFDRDLDHIRGLGWEQSYANQLSAYIHTLDKPAQEAAQSAGR